MKRNAIFGTRKLNDVLGGKKQKQEQNKINYLSINFNTASKYLSKSGGKYVCYNQEI